MIWSAVILTYYWAVFSGLTGVRVGMGEVREVGGKGELRFGGCVDVILFA